MRNALSLVCLLGIPCASVAQTNHGSWANLSKLAPGQKIQVVEATRKKHSGVFESVSDSAVAFKDSTGELSVQKQDVRSVKLMENHHRLRNTLIGLGLGAGAGAAITLSTCHVINFTRANGICAGVGLGGGGVIGTVIGAVVPEHDTIYSATSH
jgi:hypothetical protein